MLQRRQGRAERLLGAASLTIELARTAGLNARWQYVLRHDFVLNDSQTGQQKKLKGVVKGTRVTSGNPSPCPLGAKAAQGKRPPHSPP